MITTQALADGSVFAATERHVPETPPFGHFGNDRDKLGAWVSEKWNLMYEMKRGETERLKTCESFYSGFHYVDPLDNRNNPVTNYCSSTVETIWPILTQARLRPEPVPRSPMDAQRIKRIRDFATYKMDTSGFDSVFRMCVRDLLKYGWCCPMLSWDSRGASVARYLSPFDLYPDGAANDHDLEMVAIARPASVRRLQAEFPQMAKEIRADNIASPSYSVMVQPYLENYTTGGRFSMPQFIGTMVARNAVMEGQPAATTTAGYVADTGYLMPYGQTAFLIQLFVRDYSTMRVRYEGVRHVMTSEGMVPIPHSMYVNEPCSPSGWVMVPILANGAILNDPLPVDPCLGGLPFEIGRNYENGGRWYARGELDDVIPIQRDINRADVLIARALELQGNPPVKVTGDSRLMADRSSVEGGDLLRLRPGSQMEYLQPNSVAESHFERRAGRRQDIQIVAGTPDSLQGQRPVGVEAAAAIRQLTESGASRARAKGPEILDWAARFLKKMIRADAMKSEDVLYFRSSDGTDMWMRPEELMAPDYDLRWARNSGDAQGEQDRIDLDKELFQMGVIDRDQVLEDLDYPDRANILNRMYARDLQMAVAQAGAQKDGGPPK